MRRLHVFFGFYPPYPYLKIDISNYEDPRDNYQDPTIISEHILKPSILRKNGIENIDVWNHDFTKEIRESMLDGSYKFCSKELCPHLNTLLNTNKVPDVFVEKVKLPFKDTLKTFLPNLCL